MNAPATPPASTLLWNPIHGMAAAVASLAPLVALGNVCYLRQDIGTDGWWPGSLVLGLVGIAYLIVSPLDHGPRGRRPASPPRAEPWLSILILVLGWFVLARGPS